jgi:hypothetical protein
MDLRSIRGSLIVGFAPWILIFGVHLGGLAESYSLYGANRS